MGYPSSGGLFKTNSGPEVVILSLTEAFKIGKLTFFFNNLTIYLANIFQFIGNDFVHSQ